VRKLLEIRSGRHPFQVATAAACPIAALNALITGSLPPSVQAALASPYAEAVLTVLAVGGVVSLIGSYYPGELIAGLLTEGGGIAAMAGMLSVYAAALFLVSGLNAAAAGGFLVALSAAAWWRAGQILVDVRKVHRARRRGITAQVSALVDPGSPPTGPGAQ
jgi:hypothetical protein